ncbi:MAG: hypothetical protein M0D55_18190 [Elusimicrobiota bacterium]|nr:MAG: hypothetical protein M0D55_18190 [Elusimicrobiota bacterium]
MIKTALSLYITLLVTVSPVAAQMQEGASAGRAGTTPIGTAGINTAASPSALPALPAASAGLTSALAPSVAPVVSLLEAAALKPESLRALAANPSPAAVYARALVAAPAAPAAVRAEAVKALGEAAVLRLEAAAGTMNREAAGTPRASAVLRTVAAEFAALENRAPETLAAGETRPAKSVLSAPKRAWRAVKTVAAAATMAVTMAVASPAVHAQDARAIIPGFNPTSIMAQAGANQSQAEVLHVRDINEAIAKWTPKTKLIIMGNPGLDASAQRSLIEFLADKHWTVIVAESASGMSYSDNSGTWHGKEALEFGSSHGIFRKGGFAGQTDAVSGLADGTIFIISMQDRYLHLHNSEAQRLNGLDGERNFAGNLDQWAKARLRAGGDIQGAIKETVANIDARLQSAVASAAQSAKSTVASAKSDVDEYARVRESFVRTHGSAAATTGAADLAALRAKLAAADKALAAKNPSEAARLASDASSIARAATSQMSGYETNHASAKASIASVRSEIDALEKASASFLKAHPKANGDIARPDVRAMREKLSKAESALAGNPSGAASAAQSVASEVRRVQAALAEHAAGAGQIAAQEKILSDLEGRERAGAASGDLVTAKQSLREAREQHELGSSQWASQLQSAKSALANAERSISDADAAAAAAAFWSMFLMIALGVLTLGTSLTLNFFARRARKKALAELAKWDAILEAKLDTVIDQLDTRMDVYVGAISGEKSRGWEDETAAAAAKVRQDAGRAKLYLALARFIHDKATALARPKAFSWGWTVNTFWPSRYKKAESLLAKENLAFEPKDGFGELFEKKGDWREDLYGDATQYEGFSDNFDSVMAKFNAASKSAVAALDEIEKASTGYGAAFDATEAAIAAAGKKAAEAAAGAFFKVEALGSEILPKASETLAAARAKAAKNPVGAMKGQGAHAERMAADAKALSELALTMREGELSTTDPVVAAMTAAAVGTKWISDARASLDAQASALAGSLVKTSGEKGLAALASTYAEHASNLSKAKNGLAAIAASRADAVKSAAAVESGRASIASALGLEAADMMRETKTDPTQRLEAAAAALDEASKLLGKGKLADAEDAQRRGADLIAQADAIVAASLKSVSEQQRDVDGRISEAQRLDALQAERAKVLKGIKAEFAESTLKLSAGDASHPSANGTIDDNVDEAQAAIDAAKTKREKAVRVYREAKVLEAASLLDQAMAHEQIAQSRLDEIAEKRTRLDAAVAANKAKIEQLEGTVRKWKTEIPDDRRSMKATMTAYQAAGQSVAAARALVDAKKGDPFKAQADLAAAETELKQLWVKVQNDRDAWDEVVRSLKAADSQLGSAAQQAREAQGDGVADSPAITSALRELANLRSAYTTAVASSEAAHGDWPKIDGEADRITRDAAHVAATLRGEIAEAARATSAISNASSKVREATNWTGSYGVSVPGSPGSGSLNSAKSALNNGDYDGAIRHAESARSAAISAIQTAEAEVSRRRREEEEERRRQEEARRRREREEEDRRQRSSGGSGGGFSSGGGGSSWGGSSSGGGNSSW